MRWSMLLAATGLAGCALASAAPVRPRAAVLLARHGQAFVPVACIDASGRPGQGEACAEVAPRAARWALDDGRQAGEAARAPTGCDADRLHMVHPRRVSGLELGAPGEARAALWPPELSVHWFAPRAEPRTLPPADEAAVRAAARAADDVPVLVWQVLSLDLDGDGRDETLYSVSLPRCRECSGWSFSGLLLRAGDAPARVLAAWPRARYLVVGVTDLDGDGAPELIVSMDYDAGASLSLVRVTATGLARLGAWTCGD